MARKPPELAALRVMVTVFAGGCVVFGILWLIQIIVRSNLGPLTHDATASILVFLILSWVVVNLVLEAMTKRARQDEGAARMRRNEV